MKEYYSSKNKGNHRSNGMNIKENQVTLAALN
jgi:hypothetical protein